MHDRSAVTIEQAAKKEECSPNIDIGNIDVPVLVRIPSGCWKPVRLRDALVLWRPIHQSGIAEYSGRRSRD